MAWEPNENVKVLDNDEDALMIKKLERINQLSQQALGMVPTKQVEWIAQYKSVPIGIPDKEILKIHMQSAINDMLKEMQIELQKAIDLTL
jgi:hypothetical protein